VRIDPDSRSVQGLTTFLHFVALNVLYIVACLPVVTAGAATAALYEVTLRYADEERGYLLSVVLVVTSGFSVGAYVDALVLHSVFRRRGGDPTALDPVSPHSGE
jgi:hypothetical protein